MPALDFDFVYLPDGETEFNNVHITLDIVKKEGADYCYELSIDSSRELSRTDVDKIIEELEQKRFKKMNISLTKDCKIVLTSTKGRSK